MSCDIHVTGQCVQFGTLRVRRGELVTADLHGYSIRGPTTAANVLRIARGLLVSILSIIRAKLELYQS